MQKGRKMLEAVAKLLAVPMLMFPTQICVMISLSPCSAQAPGDGDSRCTGASDAPTYPDNEKTLMDSYHYLQLLPGNGSGNIIPEAVWNDRSLDGNDKVDTINPTYWQQGAGGVCRFQIRVCGWEFNRNTGGTQNNWLFTQHINKDFDSGHHNYTVQIRVEVIYALQDCRSRLGCDMGFRLHNYKTNTQQLSSTTGSGYMNTENYTQFGRARSPDQTAQFETHTFTLDPSETGFYVALQDIGTCVGISRLRVYHYNCPWRQVGLVNYTETPAALSDRPINTKCVKNASNFTSLQVTCYSNGTWGPENPVCKCDCGHEEKSSQCCKCPDGTYSLVNDTTCQPCPNNTVMTGPDDPKCICECLDGYFRYKAGVDRPNVPGITWPSSDEGPRVGCSQPPNAPRDLRLTDVQSTSITISWAQPSEDGGRPDLYYQIEYFPTSAQDNRAVIYVRSTTTHRITSLKPYTQYTIRVSAHNGVSDQDPDRSQSRTVEQTDRTAEDVPGKVRDLQCFSQVLIWQAPAEPNGVIRHYELNYTRNEKFTILSTEGAQTFHLADSLPGDSGPFTVEVRTRNGAGLGQSLCTLECDPEKCSSEPTTCRLCPRQQVELVIYPDTSVPEENSKTVETHCVENAESVTSLDVTCDSSGNWGSENPQCSCKEGFTQSPDNQKCLGVGTPPDPSTAPPTCLSCPEEIETVIDAKCTDVLIYWKPVSKAQGYRLQFHEKDDVFLDTTADGNIFKISLSDSSFKDKEMFSINISAELSLSDGSSKIEMDVMELTKQCCSVSDTSDSEDMEMDTLSLAIAIVATFVVTALLVAFLATTIGLVVSARKKRSSGKGDANGMHSTSQYPMRDYDDIDEKKSDLN